MCIPEFNKPKDGANLKRIKDLLTKIGQASKPQSETPTI